MKSTEKVFENSQTNLLSAVLAVALMVPAGAFADTSYDMAAMTYDLQTLQAQTMPMPSGIAAMPEEGSDATGRLDGLYNFIEGVASVQGPAFSAGANPSSRLNVADLWKAAQGVYNTLDARCTFWLENAAPPASRVSLPMVAARIEALETGAQITGLPGARARVSMAQVDALMVKLEDFVAGFSAMPSYRPWENNLQWRMNLKSLTESMNTFYYQVEELCGDLRS